MSSTLILTPPRTIKDSWERLLEGTLCQVINNTLITSPSPSDRHQKILGKIFSTVLTFVELHSLGEVRIPPYDVYFDDGNIFQPDIILITPENINKIKDKGLVGAPDLVIEVLSPSNAAYDKVDKKAVYEKAGVKEYFIIEPFEKNITAYFLINDEFVEVETSNGRINSKLLNKVFKF